MKILQIIPEINVGGAERFLLELSKAFYKEDYVDIISFKDIEHKNFIFKELKKYVNLTTFGKQKKRYTFFFSFISFLKNKNYDLIITHLSPIIIYVLFCLLIIRKLKIIHIIHYDITKPTCLIYIVNRLFFGHPRVTIVTLSKKTDITFNAIYKKQNKTKIINTGLSIPKISSKSQNVKNEIENFKISSADKVFISIGRLVPVKNFRLLLFVFDKIYKNKKNAILLIIGYDPTADQKELINLKKIRPPNAFLLGQRQNVADYLFHSYCFCLSSFSEGIPMSILEAMALGLPVISTNVGGIQDIIVDEENGFLVKDNTAYEYYKTINKMIELPLEQYNKMNRNNRIKIKSFYSIGSIASQYKKLVQ